MEIVSELLPLAAAQGEDSSVEVDSEWERTISSVSSKSSSVMFVCPHEGCSKYFSKEGRLNRHFLCHTGERPFKCSEEGCEVTYTRSSHLQRHVDNVHRKERFQCKKCPADFFGQEALRKHDRIAHGGGARFGCKVCGKTFSKRNHLTNHVAEHEGKLPHECKICGKQFPFPNKLRIHVAKHDAQKSHKCDKCGDEFKTWSEVRKHLARVHPLKRKCETCGTEFKSKGNYDQHVKTHAEKREIFNCPVENCDKNFVRLSNLKDHLKVTHDGVRFFCTFSKCDQHFTSRQRLAAHFATHSQGALKKPKQVVKKSSRERKDKGTVKKTMASILSSTEIEANVQKKRLLADSVEPIQASNIEKEIIGQPELLQDFLQANVQDEKAAGQICLKQYCNENRVQAAQTKILLKGVKSIKETMLNK